MPVTLQPSAPRKPSLLVDTVPTPTALDAPPPQANVAEPERNAAVVGSDRPKSFAPTAGGIGAKRADALLAMRAGKPVSQLTSTLQGILAERDAKTQERTQLVTERDAEKTELDGMKLGVRERWLGSWAGALGGDADKGKHGTDLKADIATHDDKIAKLDADIAAIPKRMSTATSSDLVARGDSVFVGLDKSASAAVDALRSLDDLRGLVSTAKSDVSSASSAESWETVDSMFKQKDSGIDFAELNARSQVSTAQSSMQSVKDAVPSVVKKLEALGHDADVGNVKTTDAGNSWGWLGDFTGMSMWSSFAIQSNLSSASSELSTLSSNLDRVRAALAPKVDAAVSARDQYVDTAMKAALDG